MVLQTTTPSHAERPIRVMSGNDKSRRQSDVTSRLCGATENGELTDDTSSIISTLSEDSTASGENDASVRNKSPQEPMRRSDYPIVGWGWLMCGAAFVAQFVCHGFQLASGVMSAGIQRHVNVTATQTGETCHSGLGSLQIL